MKKQKFAQLDMTRGNILPAIAAFSVPLLIGNLFQLLYNTVDSVVIGNFAGTEALAAVGACSSPMMVLQAVLFGIGGGVSILVSQAFGSGNHKQVGDIVQTANGFFLASVLPITILSLLLIDPLLSLISIQNAARASARIYLLVVFGGLIGGYGYNLISAILRGLGDSRSPLLFLLIACILNIILDLLFVAVFHWGVFGVALATVIAQTVSWLYSLVHIKRHFPQLHFKFFTLRMQRKYLARMLAYGLPMALNQGVYALGFLIYYRFINGFGDAYMAAYGVASKIDNLSWLPVSSLGTAAMTFAGQNKGAGNYAHLRKGVRVLLSVAVGINMLTSATLLLVGRPLLGLFTADPVVIEAGYAYLLCVAPVFWVYTIMYILINYMNGVGDVKIPTLITMFMFWGVRLPVAWYLSRNFDGNLLHLAFPASWIAGCIMTLLYYRHHKKHHLIF